MLWLYLDFHALQLDALHAPQTPVSKEPETHDDEDKQAVILVESKHHQVVQCDQVAMEVGIRPSMGLAMAVSLFRQVSVLEYKPELELQKIKEIAQLLYRFTADIVLSSPNGLFLRIDTMLRLYGGLEGYWNSLKQALTELGYKCHFATGMSPFMAKVLAKSRFNQVTEKSELMSQALEALDIEQVGLENKTVEHLKRVGIKQLKQLTSVPAKELAKRFDIQLINYIGKLKGEFKHGLCFYQPPRTFSADIELMYEIVSTQVLHHPIKRLLLQLQQYLKLRNLVTQQLTLLLMYRYQEFLTVEINAAGGEYKSEKWLLLIQLRLESVILTEPVIAVRLVANSLRPMRAPNGQLFQRKTDGMAEEELVALLQAKVGQDKVFSMQFQQAQHPQLVSQLVEVGLDKNTGTLPSCILRHRPSLMLAVAKPLTQNVTLLHGPERLQTSWWHRYHMHRDYFVARESNGKLCWVYRTPQQQWFLQGYFA